MSSTGWATAISTAAGLIAVGSGWWVQREPAQLGLDDATLASAATLHTGGCTDDAGELTHDRVSGAVRDFLPGVLPCVPGAQATPADTLHLRLDVACTGAVRSVELVEHGDWPGQVVQCVRNRLQAVWFPVHAAEEGAVVDLPLRFPPLDASPVGR